MTAHALVVAAIAATLALPLEAAQKFDGSIQRMTQDPAQLRREVLLQKRGPIPTIDVILRVKGDGVSQLRREGVLVRSVIGNIVTADVPAGRLADIAALDGVEYMEASKSLPSRLNASVPATRAKQLWSGVLGSFTGATGAGVIVGVPDDGVDFRHRDFRKLDGTTRIVALWDQRGSATYGSPPAGFTYGVECTPQMINDAIAGSGGCQQPSTGGHGTHVAGIAAGNGRGTGNGQAADRFIGMAPEADIIVANSIGARSGAVLDAVNFMVAKARSLGKPIAINLSLGSYFGPRDGTSNFEKGLDAASGAGAIIAAAAGNEGGDPIRATATLSQGGTATFRVRLPAASKETEGAIEIWYPGSSQYSVSVTPPGCPVTAAVAPGETGTLDTTCGKIEISSSGVQANNDDRQIQIAISAGTSPVVRDRDYVITLTGTSVSGGSATVSAICGQDAGGLVFSAGTTPVTSEILTDTSSATRVIGVAAYNTNYLWASMAGPRTHPGHGSLGDLSDFSSRGPRRDCSSAAKCPHAMKPEIAAPGSMIMAAYSSDIGASKASQPTEVEADGVHTAYNGTSMATPHVTGAIALLLSKNPALTPEEVRAILFTNVQMNGFTTGLPAYNPASPLLPANPNYGFGYGILDVKKAYDAVGGGTTPSASNYTALWWNPGEPGWGVNFNHQGSTLFGTLFTYEASRAPLWLVMSAGAQQADGSFQGDLYQTTGPAFNANPFTPIGAANVTKVGTMSVAFSSADAGVLNYTVNGTSVRKDIQRQVYDTRAATCTPTNGSRASATNYQDLWWNAAESGWGVNVTHQNNTLFATLFTYDSSGKGLWLVMSAGTRQGDGSYLGDLFQTAGPAFNTVPFTGVGVATVGSMRLNFSSGESGTLTYTYNGVTVTKAITRQTFATPVPLCAS